MLALPDRVIAPQPDARREGSVPFPVAPTTGVSSVDVTSTVAVRAPDTVPVAAMLHVWTTSAGRRACIDMSIA